MHWGIWAGTCPFPCHLCSTRCTSWSREPGLRGLREHFSQRKNITAKRNVYFWAVLLSSSLLWTYSELLSCLGLLSMVAAPMVTSGSVRHPAACCAPRCAPETDWHHPGQMESWTSFVTTWFIHCSIGQWYRPASLKSAPCGTLWRRVYQFHRSTESWRLEKTSKIISSNHQSITPMPAKPCPEVLHLHSFLILLVFSVPENSICK